MSMRRRRRHTPEPIVRKLRNTDTMLNAGKDEAAVLQVLAVSQATYDLWRKHFGGMTAEEAKRLKELEQENRYLKELVAKKELDIQLLKQLQQVARERRNTFEALVKAARVCSLGSMSHALYDVGGEYRRNM